MQAFSARSGVSIISEHDETSLGVAGQEELYLVLRGAATFEIDGEVVEAPTGAMVQVRRSAKRKATATEDDNTILAVGGTTGEAYKPAPEEASEAFGAYGAGDYETALAKQLVVVEKQPDNAVAHFNAGCFAARAGHALTRRSSTSGGRSRSTSASGSSWPATRTSTPFAKIRLYAAAGR